MTIRAYLIDPAARTITLVELPLEAAQSFQTIYPLLGCQCCEFVPIAADAALIVDEEGWLKRPGAFVGCAGRILAGKALLVRVTPESDIATIPEQVPFAAIIGLFHWPTFEQVRAYRDRGGLDGRMTTWDAAGKPIVTPMPFRPELAGE